MNRNNENSRLTFQTTKKKENHRYCRLTAMLSLDDKEYINTNYRMS